MLAELRRHLAASPTIKLGFILTGAGDEHGYGYGYGYAQRPQPQKAKSKQKQRELA